VQIGRVVVLTSAAQVPSGDQTLKEQNSVVRAIRERDGMRRVFLAVRHRGNCGLHEAELD